MSTLAKILGAYAPGHVLTHKERSWTFCALDQTRKAALESSFFKRAREAVYEQKNDLPEDEYQRQLDRVTDRRTRGDFAFRFGSECHRYFTGEGIAELVSVLTGQPVADCQTLLEERGADVGHLVLCVIMDSFPNVKGQLLKAEEEGKLPQEVLQRFQAVTRC